MKSRQEPFVRLLNHYLWLGIKERLWRRTDREGEYPLGHGRQLQERTHDQVTHNVEKSRKTESGRKKT